MVLDLHQKGINTLNCISLLDTHIELARRNNRFLEVITGYGSNGGTKKIRNLVIEHLDELIKEKRIKAYLPGEYMGDIGKEYIEFLKVCNIPNNVKKAPNKGIIYVAI